MTKHRLAWMFVLMLAVVTGLVAGGPREIDPTSARALTGADPFEEIEPCNGKATVPNNCATGCLTGSYDTIRPEQPNTMANQRYNNDALKCGNYANTTCAHLTVKKVEPKTCNDSLIDIGPGGGD